MKTKPLNVTKQNPPKQEVKRMIKESAKREEKKDMQKVKNK